MLKKRLILILAALTICLLMISCSGKDEESSSVPSQESSFSSSKNDETTSSQEDPPTSKEEQPVYTTKISISNDFPELELQLFAQQDEAGLYHATRLEIYHASISTLPMQTIEISDCESDTPDFLLTVEDMNFDGVKDIRLVSSKGIQNIYYHCYLWNIDSASFEQDTVLSGLSSPKVVEADKAVAFYEHISATDYREGEMRFLDGEWTLTKEKTQTYDSATGLFTVITREMEGGTMAVTSQETLTQQQVEESMNSSY